MRWHWQSNNIFMQTCSVIGNAIKLKIKATLLFTVFVYFIRMPMIVFSAPFNCNDINHNLKYSLVIGPITSLAFMFLCVSNTSNSFLSDSLE